MAQSSSSRSNADNNTDSLHPPSTSRPRSILNVSRTSALVPSLSSHTPINELSTSPSDRSIMSNGNRNGTGGAAGFSALNRLKRVASNASIASSSKLPQQKPTAVAAATVIESSKVSNSEKNEEPASVTGDERKDKEKPAAQPAKAVNTQADSSQAAQSTSIATPHQEETASSNTIKRPRSPATRQDTAVIKQARRKTWFGFGAAANDDGDVAMADAEAKEPEEGSMQKGNVVEGSGERDVEMSDAVEPPAADQPAPSKSWAAWRGPSGPDNANTQAPNSYTDTVLRYVSGASTQSIAWSGWPLWRSDASQQVDKDPAAPEAEMATDTEQVEAGPSKTLQTPSATSPAQPSMLGRWWPAWKAEDAKVELPQEAASPAPPTPAEQVKADALARMGAKDAVLNEATRSTWINYFSTRSALPSSKVEDKDRGPEVMELDLHPAKQPTTAASVTSTKNEGKGKAPANSSKDINGRKNAPNQPNADPAPPTSRPSTPLTNDKDKANKVVKAASAPAKGKKGDNSSKMPKGPPPPNLLLPSFDDTFLTAPRSTPPSRGMLEKTLSYLFSRGSDESTRKARKSSLLSIGASRADTGSDAKEHEAQTRLPRMWNVMGDKERAQTKGCKGVKKITIIGVHGWFSQGPLRNLFGEPTGTSIKFATMMSNAVKEHFEKAGQTVNDDQISAIALEADGQVADRVNM
jgi:hypothetical protein